MRLVQFLSHGAHQSKTHLTSIIVLLLGLLPANSSGSSYLHLIDSAPPGCATSSPASGSYTVTVCLTRPSSGATLTGNTTVTATASATGSDVQRMVYYLDGTYLLTDYSSPYTFVLPTAKWADGNHLLSVSALMRDGFVSARAVRPVVFSDGVATPPGNPNEFLPTSGRAPASGSPFVVAAAGDGASGQPTSASVVGMLKSANPNLFLYLGDVYQNGSLTEFFNWYDGSSYFGALRSITDPTVGNHEYLTPNAAGYYDYWNNVPKYYSFNANGWHFISLNSNTSYVSAAQGSAQYDWLKADLSRLPPRTCTIVYYHHPYFNVGPEGSATGMSSVWKLLAQYHVDIVLNGHDHDYQRWKPLDANGNVDPRGVTEFVVGGGGHGLQTFTRAGGRVAYQNDANPAAFGALFLTLHAAGADFKYQNTLGTVLDSGTVPCVSPTSAVRFMVKADSFVDSSDPGTNFGARPVLRVDASPVQVTYLRFRVWGLNGSPISRVRLRVHANSSTTLGLMAAQVAVNKWGETTITYANMPPAGNTIAAVQNVHAGKWVTFDVTHDVNGNGVYSFGIVTSGSTSVSLASREAGSYTPRLVVDLGT